MLVNHIVEVMPAFTPLRPRSGGTSAPMGAGYALRRRDSKQCAAAPKKRGFTGICIPGFVYSVRFLERLVLKKGGMDLPEDGSRYYPSSERCRWPVFLCITRA